MDQTNQNTNSLPPSFLEAVLHNVADGVIACDANGIMIGFNRTTQQTTGSSTAPAIGPDDWPKAFGVLKADGSYPSKEEMPLYRALCGEIIRGVEFEYFKKDGTHRIYLCNGQAIHDDSGKKLGAVVTMQDITAIKKAVKVQAEFNQELEKMVELRTRELQSAKGALTDSEKRFRTLFEQSPLSVQLLSVDGKTIAVNDAWKKILDIPDDFIESYILKEYNILNDPLLEKHGVSHLIRKAFNGTSVKIPAIRYDPSEVGKRGRARWTEAFLHPILDENKNVQELVLIHNDVTEKIESEIELKRAKEEAEQASRLKSSFLANMSHEIRTPLAAMIGYAQLLKSRDVNSDESQRFLDLIERNAMSLARIIDDILDLSKVEAGRLDVKKLAVSLKVVFEEVASLFEIQLSEIPVTLVIKPIPQSLKKIKTDPLRLRQILINLIGNALKFTKNGSVTVEAREIDDNNLMIDVTDTGIGIPSDLHDHLFESFRQADNTYTRQFSGTGLGLALSRRLAKALGGDVQLVSSTSGVGSTFSVTLPLEPLDGGDTHAAVSAASLNSKTSKLEGIKLLVADDFDDIRQLVVRVLRLNGATVTEVTNGRDVVLKVPVGSYDAVLIDVQMPIMDGLQATRLLREKGFTNPIIVLTAHALVDERERCFEAGASAHLGKPVNFQVLISTIKKLVDKN